MSATGTHEAYCARCRRRQPVERIPSILGRDYARCHICGRSWPVGAAKPNRSRPTEQRCA